MLAWNTSKGRHLGERCSNSRLWQLHAAVAWLLARAPSAACSVEGETDSGWFGVPPSCSLGEQSEYRLAIGADPGLTTSLAEKTRVLLQKSLPFF